MNAKRGGRGHGGRQLKTWVKTAKRRKNSSTRWLERQLNDPYVARAKEEGYRSRAAFKLIEIDDRYELLKPGQCVLDLGAALGGWTQIAVDRTEAIDGEGRVVAIDILGMEPVTGAEVAQIDFMDDDAPAAIRDMLGGPADLVLSDMAPPTTGHRQTDHLRIMGLFEAALDFTREVLKPGGSFLAKVWRGGTEAALLNEIKREFSTVRHVKPDSSRSESPELFVLATGYRPQDGMSR